MEPMAVGLLACAKGKISPRDPKLALVYSQRSQLSLLCAAAY